MDDSRHRPRISLAEISLSEMMTKLQICESKYGRSECSTSRDVHRCFEGSSSEDVEDRSTDDDKSGSDYADPYHFDELRRVATANDAESRTEAIGTYGRSENRSRRGDFPNRSSTVTHATKAQPNGTVSMNRVRHAGELTTLPTTATSVVNGVSKCMMSASVKLSRP
ncbi:unnamed protein product [Phytophthora fragariaefolia]|uniref:Unnamed protein product n=1 Tax=Phytophthora fragariaefolia TaxID=1490495 RepID=A0A9W6XWU1_9STRA|nr:unnamed protein product [Phytophthora fragariaefolia]